MIITNKVNMDLQQPGFVPAIHAVQDDRYVRNVELTLSSGGEAWTVPETASVRIRYSKSDGKGGEYDVLPDGTQAWSAADNLLTVALAPQVLTTAGPVHLAVILSEESQQLSCFRILLNVQEAVGQSIAESEDYLHIAGFLPAPACAKAGQFFRAAAVDEHGHVTEVEAVDAEAAAGDSEGSDEELLLKGYTLTRDDFIHGIWSGEMDAGSDTPYHTENVDTKFCTRKLKTTILPRVSYYYFTTPLDYVFWNKGVYAGKVAWTELSENWAVDFVFDEVGITFSWGWDYIDSEVIVTLTGTIPVFQKVLVIGDSISADYYGEYPKWVTMLIDEGFFPPNTVNDSIHATGFVAEYTAEGDVDNNFNHRIQAVEDKSAYDLVVVFGGINDYIQSVPMGASGDDDTANFVPAVDTFFAYLVENFPQARIVVLSPLQTYNVYENAVGCLQTEYADYIRQAAKRCCLPVLNLTEESGFCPFQDAFKAMWTLIPEGYEEADGVHPNEAWQKQFLAPQIRNFLRQFV